MSRYDTLNARTSSPLMVLLGETCETICARSCLEEIKVARICHIYTARIYYNNDIINNVITIIIIKLDNSTI